MAGWSKSQGRRLADSRCSGTSIAQEILRISRRFRLLTSSQLPLAGMTTTTALTVRYGEGKHIIFITDPEGFAKVYYNLCIF